ncbi:vegetative cell wall protein gp1-like [Amphibalanus amphitrite]|uniref:vegetative cell wall protein gp1-like n=1 Tax=Amphibalanus amphitrite TaxID=1232801 RepID=UPI001C90ECF6|nr:vegetative cell wall protein gp1-like [Amphibalanus amphitrite]
MVSPKGCRVPPAAAPGLAAHSRYQLTRRPVRGARAPGADGRRLAATALPAGRPALPPPPLPQPPEPPPPPPPPAEDRPSSRSGRRSPAVEVPRPHGHSGTSRSARSHTTERNLPAVSSNTPAAAAVSPAPPAPPAAPTLAWLPALERLEVRLQISAVTVTVPAGPESGGGAAGDAERTADPLPAAAGHHPAPVPGRVRSSSDSGHRYCLHGQLVSVLPSVRLDSAALKSAALPTVPEVPVRLTRPSAAAAGSQLRSPSQTQQVMSPSVVVRDCAPMPRPTPPPPPPQRAL